MIARFLVLGAGIVMTACVTSAQTSDRAADIAKIKTAKLETWPAIYDTYDEAWLGRFLNDDFVFIDNSGTIETKAQIMSWMSTSEPPADTGGQPDDFIYTIKDIVFVEPTVAIVYGHGDSTRKTDTGEPCAHNYWSSNLLRKVGDDWRPSFSHVSAVSCTPFN